MAPADGDLHLLPAFLLSTAMLASCREAPHAAHEPVQVAAASDLSAAFEELGQLFEAQTGQKVTFSFAASGALSKQLTQGAPFDVFAAANASFVDSAVQSGACDGSSKACYARGHVLAWSKSVKLKSLADLQSPEIKRIAIANPEHAPYGKAAREALMKAGLWKELEPKIVQAENVRQALQFAQTGNAEVALIALSLVATEGTGHKLAIDPTLHAPIDQTLVVCRRGKNLEGGRAFAKLVESKQGQALLQRYGFGSAQ